MVAPNVSSSGRSTLYPESVIIKSGFSTYRVDFEDKNPHLLLTPLYETYIDSHDTLGLPAYEIREKVINIIDVIETIKKGHKGIFFETVEDPETITLQHREDENTCLIIEVSTEANNLPLNKMGPGYQPVRIPLVRVLCRYEASVVPKHLIMKRSTDLVLKSMIPVYVRGDHYYF